MLLFGLHVTSGGHVRSSIDLEAGDQVIAEPTLLIRLVLQTPQHGLLQPLLPASRTCTEELTLPNIRQQGHGDLVCYQFDTRAGDLVTP